MSDQNNIYGIWASISPNIQVLAIAGVGGALIKALVAPEKSWKRRISQAGAGVLTAVFLGGFIADFAGNLFPGANAHYLLLAIGALCAFGGEGTMAFVQKKVFGGSQ